MAVTLKSQIRLTAKQLPSFQCATALISVAVFIFAGCEQAENRNEPSQKTFGVTLLTVQHQFYQELRRGLEEEADKHGYRLHVSTAELDPARQVLYGNDFFRREFGKQSVDFMLPDCFGFPASMPRLASLVRYPTGRLSGRRARRTDGCAANRDTFVRIDQRKVQRQG